MKPPTPTTSSKRAPRVHHKALIEVWRWRIAAATEPIPLNWALAVGDAVMEALTMTAWTLTGSGRLPICLHGPRDPKSVDWDDGHAFFLSEDADNDGVIDHIAVSAPVGLDPSAVRLLAATDRIALSSGTRAELTLERAGRLEMLDPTLYGPSQSWISSTPFLPDGNGRADFNSKDAVRQLKSAVRRPIVIAFANAESSGRARAA